MNSADDWLESASKKVVLKNYPGAITDYTQAISLKPDYVAAYFNRGLAKFALNDNQGAIADYTKTINLKPNDAVAYSKRGIVYLMLNQRSKALADFMKAKDLGYRVSQEAWDLCG